MIVCPQCGYERKDIDNNFVSIEECPKCGVFYKKWKPSNVSQITEPILTNNDVPNPDETNIQNRKNSIFIMVCCISMYCFLVLFVMLPADSKMPAHVFDAFIHSVFLSLLVLSALILSLVSLFRGLTFSCSSYNKDTIDYLAVYNCFIPMAITIFWLLVVYPRLGV